MDKFIGILILLLAVAIGNTAMAAGEVERANQLIEEGKYIEAFELLEPLEFDLSGDENFDLLFGFSALEAGHISLATLALERVLAVNPDNNIARFHLARAYFVLSDYDGARREFEMLLSMNPTAGIRETVGQYLDAIAAREPASSTVITGFVSAGLGRDSNVTGGPSSNPIFIPALGTSIPLQDSDLEDEDSYGNLSAGIDLVHRSSETGSIYVGGNLNSRKYGDRDELDTQSIGLRTGYQRAFGNQVLRAGLNASKINQDGEAYQQNGGLELEWRNTLAQRTQIGAVLAQTAFRHDEQTFEDSDYDDTHLSLSALRVLGESGNKLISTAIGFGREKAVKDRFDGDMNYYDISLTGQIQFTDLHSAFALISYRNMKYDTENALFLKKRNESQTALVAGLVYGLSTTLSIRATVVISETRSNVELYDVDRQDITLALRKDFL